MKFAFAIFRYFPFGGLQRDMLALAEEALIRGHSVTVFCGSWEGELPLGIKMVRVATPVLFNTAGIQKFMRGFSQVFVRDEFDLLVGFNKMPGLDIYYCGDSCFAHKAYSERSWFYRLTPRARLYLSNEHAVFDCSINTNILEVASVERQLFAKYYGTQTSRFHLLPPGLVRAHVLAPQPTLARASLREKYAVSAAAKVVLCVGSGFKTKGIDRSLEVFAQASHLASHPMQLWIVGQGDSTAFRTQAEHLGISDRVKFLGARTDVANIYAAVDILLHCAYHEVTGNVLLEAMLAGLPVLASAVCGYGHYVVEQQMGELVAEPFDVTHATQKLQQWLSVDRALLAERAQQFAANGEVFARPQRALDYLESQQQLKTQFTAQQQAHTSLSGYTLVLRDELISHWRKQDVFALAKHQQGVIARELPDRRTLRFEINENGYYCKYHRGVGWGEIIKNCLQLRWPVLGAENEWSALNRLQALAIPSLIPLAYGKRGTNPASQESFIVTRELLDVVQLDHYFESQSPSIRQVRAIIHRLAKLTRAMHNAGINHRDFYLCHFMLKSESMQISTNGGLQPEIYVMDLHRAQCRAQVPLRWLIKDLGGLYFSTLNLTLSRRDIYRFMRAYWNMSLPKLVAEQKPLLRAIEHRALRTYKRDFGYEPQQLLTKESV